MFVEVKNVSVDIESWGTNPGDDIRSIGACLFFPTRIINPISEAQVFYIACENPLVGTYSADQLSQKDLDFVGGIHRRYNLKRNPSTVMFWHGQTQELQEAFNNPIELKEALLKFSEFLYSISEDVRDGVVYDVLTWTHGAAFDPPLLEAAYIACGLKYPLYYRAPRDTRTVFDDADIENHTAHLKRHNAGPLHHALHDSISQAFAITAAKTAILTKKMAAETSFNALVNLEASLSGIAILAEEGSMVHSQILTAWNDVVGVLGQLSRINAIPDIQL